MRCDVVGCLLCYAGRRGRESFPGHCNGGRGVKKERVLRAMGLLKRPVVREAGGLPRVQQDSPLAKSYPAFFAFLTDTTWDDGSPRETGTAMVMAGDGLVKFWLHDREGSGRSLWVSGETVEDCLAGADDAIATGSGEWRVDRVKGGKGRPARS